jgi:hypothetical protein
MRGSYTTLEPPPELMPLIDCLKRIPAVDSLQGLMGGFYPDGRWWAIFWIDIDHPLSWWVVRRLAVVLNNVSEENSPTALMPIAMKPTWTIGMKPLSWIVESRRSGVEPAAVADKLKAQLPDSLEDESLWPVTT